MELPVKIAYRRNMRTTWRYAWTRTKADANYLITALDNERFQVRMYEKGKEVK